MSDTPFSYESDPAVIERESFVQIRALADLSRFDADQAQVAMRMVHTCGDPGITDMIHFSDSAVTQGLAALDAAKPILCDVEMVRHGLSRRLYDSPIQCYLNAADVASLADERGETRTMAALDYWKPQLDGAILVIGNAPTALFRLLEILQGTDQRPALIVGMPVGFIGAAESKQALWALHQQLGVQCITLLGQRGGSALAASVVNALARLQRGIRF